MVFPYFDVEFSTRFPIILKWNFPYNPHFLRYFHGLKKGFPAFDIALDILNWGKHFSKGVKKESVKARMSLNLS